jgi:hypothetical protein
LQKNSVVQALILADPKADDCYLDPDCENDEPVTPGDDNYTQHKELHKKIVDPGISSDPSK